MKMYVVVALEEWQDGNFAYAYGNVVETLDKAKEELEKATNEILKEYKENCDYDCEVVKLNTVTKITVGGDIGFITLEVNEVNYENLDEVALMKTQIESKAVQETFEKFKEQLKYNSVEKLKQSNVFGDYISNEIAENTFNLGYEITTEKVKELTEKVWKELENFEENGGFRNEN